jgi:hypothetical protein
MSPPYEGDANDVLVIASGKCNNAEEFQPFAVSLDSDTKFYHGDDSIDIEEWMQRVGAKTGAKGPSVSTATVVGIVKAAGPDGMEKQKLSTAIQLTGYVSKATAYRAIDRAESEKAIVCSGSDGLYVLQNPN